jgi:hypothetical protein
VSDDEGGGDWLDQLNASIDKGVARQRAAEQSVADREERKQLQRERAVALIRAEVLPAVKDIQQAMAKKGLHVHVYDRVDDDPDNPTWEVDMAMPGKDPLEIRIKVKATPDDFSMLIHRSAPPPGRPVAFPTDRDSITRSNVRNALVAEYEQAVSGPNLV